MNAGATSEGRHPAREHQSHVRHELRTPLAVLYPLLDSLLDGLAGELTEKQREYLVIMERNVARLAGIIASMADSGWFDCAQAPTEVGNVPLHDLVNEVLTWRESRGMTGPFVGIQCEDGAPAVARADREQARCIVGNLLDNAAHFTPEDGVVEVSLRAPRDGVVVVEIADDGCGIPAEELPRVFDFGFRGAAALEAGIPGLGVGLCVCRELAERSRGSLELRSEGRGTTAVLTLPAAD